MKKLLVLVMAVVIGFAPVLAEARAGGRSSSSFSSSRSFSSPSRSTPSYSYSSVGSKGSNTYTPSPTYKPIAQSVTPPAPVRTTPAYSAPTPAAIAPHTPTYSAPVHAPTYVAPAAPSGGGFMSSFAGGMAGSVVGNMLSGNHGGGTTVVNNGGGGYAGAAPAPMVVGAPAVVDSGAYGGNGYAAGGYAGQPSHSYGVWNFIGDIIGIIVLTALIGLIVVAVYKFINRKKDDVVTQSNSDFIHRTSTTKESTVTQTDKARFKRILTSIQHNWSNRDISALSADTTEEISDFFKDILAENDQHGVINKVDDVRDIECDVLEVWEEFGTKYATAIMRWYAHDYTTDLKGNVIDAGTRGYSRETWTFVENSYGTWVLSAIQQMED